MGIALTGSLLRSIQNLTQRLVRREPDASVGQIHRESRCVASPKCKGTLVAQHTFDTINHTRVGSDIQLHALLDGLHWNHDQIAQSRGRDARCSRLDGLMRVRVLLNAELDLGDLVR